MSDLISRQDAITVCNSAIDLWEGQLGVGALVAVRDKIAELPSVELEIIRCKDCKYWNNGNCNCLDIRVDCPDYYVGDIVTEEDFYCGFAKRREE